MLCAWHFSGYMPLPPPNLHPGKHPSGRLPVSRGVREGRQNGLDERLPVQPCESGSRLRTELFARVPIRVGGCLTVLPCAGGARPAAGTSHDVWPCSVSRTTRGKAISNLRVFWVGCLIDGCVFSGFGTCRTSFSSMALCSKLPPCVQVCRSQQGRPLTRQSYYFLRDPQGGLFQLH